MFSFQIFILDYFIVSWEAKLYGPHHIAPLPWLLSMLAKLESIVGDWKGGTQEMCGVLSLFLFGLFSFVLLKHLKV